MAFVTQNLGEFDIPKLGRGELSSLLSAHTVLYIAGLLTPVAPMAQRCHAHAHTQGHTQVY